MISDGAKKLWNAIGKKPSAPERASTEDLSVLPEGQAIRTLQAQLSVVEAATADLHRQMLASSELIKALADQNTQLVKRIEANRVRVLWLAGAIAAIGVMAVSGWVMTLVGYY